MPGHGKWQIFSRKSAHCRDAGTYDRSYVRDRSRIAFDNADFFGSVEIFGRAVGRVVCVCPTRNESMLWYGKKSLHHFGTNIGFNLPTFARCRISEASTVTVIMANSNWQIDALSHLKVQLRLVWKRDFCSTNLGKKWYLGGGFKYFLFSLPIWGRFPIWRIFFRWVVQPSTRDNSVLRCSLKWIPISVWILYTFLIDSEKVRPNKKGANLFWSQGAV